MELQNKVIVVTGAAGGIGSALCRRFAASGAQRVVVSDFDAAGAQRVADEVGGLAIPCDVASEADIRLLVARAIEDCGRIDLFVSNAGVTAKGGVDVADAAWQRCWEVNLMAHVFAARAVLPHMLERGEGYLLQVASAAGLLVEMGSAAYTATKHAAVGFAEWLSVRYRKRGIRVSCLCPAGVDTGFLNPDDVYDQFLRRSAISPEAVAESVVAGIAEERFLILPHPDVHEFYTFKSAHHDQWLDNFAHINERMERLAGRKEPKQRKPTSAPAPAPTPD